MKFIQRLYEFTWSACTLLISYSPRTGCCNTSRYPRDSGIHVGFLEVKRKRGRETERAKKEVEL